MLAVQAWLGDDATWAPTFVGHTVATVLPTEVGDYFSAAISTFVSREGAGFGARSLNFMMTT